MPRKGPASRRPLTPDPIYQSQLVTQMVNKILLQGKRSTAERIVYSALEQCRRKTGNDPVTTLKRAVSRSRREKTMADRLAGELLDASNGAGAAVKRKEDTHKMAEANRAFAHYRW
jgi:small subunit ribosomal protein S7